MWSRAGVTSCQNDFVTEGKKQMSTFEINDGFEPILFHTLLPPPDEKEEDERGEERERWRWGWVVRGGGRVSAVPGRQNFFDFTDNFLCNY